MRTSTIWLAAAVLTGAGLVLAEQAPPAPAQGRPSGSQRRPGDGRTPEFPEPTITQYKPRTTLKTVEHPVPKAKFPVIDIHSHQPTAMSDEQMARVVAGMDANNLRVLVNASGASGSRLVEEVRALKASKFQGRMVPFTDVDFRNVGPGWGAKAAAQLEADVKAGAARPRRDLRRRWACATARPTAPASSWTIRSSIRCGPRPAGSASRC